MTRVNVASPNAVLSAEDYRNYRNVRSVSRLYILLGGIFVLAGVSLLLVDPPRGDEPVHPLFAIGLALVGLCGAVGGIAALRGDRGRSNLVKVMACLYFFAFPLGTLLTYVLLKGLPQYLDSVDQLEAKSSDK